MLITIENLEKELKIKKLNSLYLLYGEETFLLESCLKKIKTNFGDVIPGINFIKIEPSENEYDIEINYADNDWDVIASYDSFDRAKEILAEIINTYKTVARVEGKEKGQPKFYNVPKVYYLPEK